MTQLSLYNYLGKMHERIESRIAEFIERNKPRWLYVEFSGGKDSAAVLAAARRVTDKVIATFLHIVGQTIEDNAVAAIRTAEKLGFTVKRVICRRKWDLRRWFYEEKPWNEMPVMVYAIVRASRSGEDYWSAVERYGFPAPTERMGGGKRWCCSLFKSEWFDERPPNGAWQGRPARFIAVGIRRSESAYRAKLWAGKTWQVFENKGGVVDVVLAPIVDLSEADVWSLLKHYGLYDIIQPQYERWIRAPNCALCPLMGVEALRNAVRNLPTNYLQRVLRVLKAVVDRHDPSTFSHKRVKLWIEIIEEELEGRL